MNVKRHRLLGLALAASFAVAAGCRSTPHATANTAEVAATQPSNVSVAAADFDALWAAIDDASRSLLFKPALEDRRSGLYRTSPMGSSQWFEPWRRELRTSDAIVQSSLASIRRTATFEVTREGDTYVARPSVRVERYSLAERRVTTSAGYRSIFRQQTPRNRAYGTAETDAGLSLPDAYWYDVGNDPALERYLANAVRDRLAS